MSISEDEGYGEFKMPAGAGLSELEAALENFEDNSEYQMYSKGGILGSRLRGLGRDELEEADDWAETADAYTALGIGSLTAPALRAAREIYGSLGGLVSGDRRSYALVKDKTDHPHVVRYREGQNRRVRIERHDLPDIGRTWPLEEEVVKGLEEEVDRLAP